VVVVGSLLIERGRLLPGDLRQPRAARGATSSPL
jgi:hypothetical protein